MMYQKQIIFNEVSAFSIRDSGRGIEEILREFFGLCLCAYNLSGQEDKDCRNLKYIRHYQDFYWQNYLPDNQSLYYYLEQIVKDDIEKGVILSLLSEYSPIDTFPHYYEINGIICNGLAYACINQSLVISLNTDSQWNNTKLQIDDIELINSGEVVKKVNVINITTIDHAFLIVEEFANRFYGNTYHQRPTFDNLLPLKEISNQYLEYIDFYQNKDDNQKGTKTEVSDKKKVAKIVAEINGWKKCSTSGRNIYKHTQCDYYIAVDTKKGDFEIHDTKGKHLGAISFDYQKAEGAVKNRKITPC